MVLIKKIQHDAMAAPACTGQSGHFKAPAVMELKWTYLGRKSFTFDDAVN
jgi:hypothetical protein